jgi:uncharacterized membrane protein YfcA
MFSRIRTRLPRLLVAFVAAAVVLVLLHPRDLSTIIAASAAAAALASLILLYSERNKGLIWQTVAWTAAGAFFGAAFSPYGAHDPEFLYAGVVAGWVLGAVYHVLRRIRKRQ